MTEEHPASIEVEGLVRVFRKGPRAVDGIDLHVEPGEIYGFLGPNGAGKSTTVLMLTTLLPPTAGTARVAGYDVVKQGPQVRGMIGAATLILSESPCRPTTAVRPAPGCACTRNTTVAVPSSPPSRAVMSNRSSTTAAYSTCRAPRSGRTARPRRSRT